MHTKMYSTPVVAGILLSSMMLFASPISGATIQEDFASDPAERGWRTHGAPELFGWNANEQHLEVTWDSSKQNSYFYRPLGTILAREDDFELRFELRLEELAVGVTEGKAFSFQVAIGLLNLREAMSTGFVRGTGMQSPNIVEFNYFPDTGFGATISTVFISSNNQFAAGFNFPLELTLGDLFQVEMSYRGNEQMLATRMLRNGEVFGPINDVKLDHEFTDYRVDAVAVSSYSDEGAEGSILARGVVDNITLILPEPPVRQFEGGLVEGVWQGQFTGRVGWSYTLERSEDLVNWEAASPITTGTGGRQMIEDSLGAAGGGSVFYRMRAMR
jgi:hypothetical protein